MKIDFNEFDYVNTIEFTDNITKDVCNLLEINNMNHTKQHVLKVAGTSINLAHRFNADVVKCYRSALLHDISAIINHKDMTLIANKNYMWLDESEEKHPFLLHQRISRLIAEEYFKIADKDILSPIECHTTLKGNPTKYEMILFLADKISWDQEGEPPYFDIINNSLNISLEKACENYINYLYDNNKLLCPHKWMNEAHCYFQRYN